MMNEQLRLRSQALEKKSEYLYEQAKKSLGEEASEEELLMYVQEYLSSFYKDMGGPLFKRRKMLSRQAPYVEDMEANMEEVAADLGILQGESNIAGEFLRDSFNYAQSERKRLLSMVGGLNGLIGDLNLIAHENKDGNSYHKESFESLEHVEEGFYPESVVRAHIATREGILSLARTESVNLSLGAAVRKVEGNGEPGTSHVARRTQIVDEYKKTKNVNVFINENQNLANDRPTDMFDGRPDTVFEYQMVNVPDSFIRRYKGYDFNWVRGAKQGDRLRLQVLVELEGLQPVNWLAVHPYYPENSTGRVKLYSVRTSKDGFEYEGLYRSEGQVLDKELNETPQTYRLDQLFDGMSDVEDSKFSGQGVFNFPEREARFIELVFEQDESYEELVGQNVYYKRTRLEGGQEVVDQIPEPYELKDRPAKEGLTLSSFPGATIDKVVEATEGWRYVIGLRDIDIMSFRYAEKSMYVSRRFEIDGDIEKVMLYANEKIPSSYLDKISTANDWVKYEVSFDDIDWYRISPMHHEPVNDAFPPKMIELNGRETDLQLFDLHKLHVRKEGETNGVRLRITLSRPESMEASTPIVEDYAIRIVKRGEGV